MFDEADLDEQSHIVGVEILAVFTEEAVGQRWRVRVSPVPPGTIAGLNREGKGVLHRAPDLAELDRRMLLNRAAYTYRRQLFGAFELICDGRGALVLCEWIAGSLEMK